MKKFYDRDSEMSVLKKIQNQSYTDYSRFVILTGRRRVGKTSLIYHLMEETSNIAPSLYFFVGRKTESVLVSTFIVEVREKLDEYIPSSINTFRELFQFLLEIGDRKSVV